MLMLLLAMMFRHTISSTVLERHGYIVSLWVYKIKQNNKAYKLVTTTENVWPLNFWFHNFYKRIKI